ncbi:hypothetical protein, partial [Pseudomonas asiatica]|uniref:hypothetical protein n=1 Tax=Pseudomonas asiatica TaxID=2219225 RepID=UPI001F36BE08
HFHTDHPVFSCSKIEQKQLNTWVSFQSAEQPLLGQFSVSGNKQATEKSEFAISIKVGERLITQYRHTYRLSWKLPLNAMRLKQGYKSLILCPQFCNQRGIAHCLEASVAEQVANLVTGRLSAYDGGHQMPSGPSGEAEENRGKKSPRVRA